MPPMPKNHPALRQVLRLLRNHCQHSRAPAAARHTMPPVPANHPALRQILRLLRNHYQHTRGPADTGSAAYNPNAPDTNPNSAPASTPGKD